MDLPGGYYKDKTAPSLKFPPSTQSLTGSYSKAFRAGVEFLAEHAFSRNSINHRLHRDPADRDDTKTPAP